jgi:capsular polysaccharide biosynthesis protein
MEENKTYVQPPVQEEEEGIDIIGLVKQMWEGRKTIIIVTAVFIVLGLVAALTMKRTYTVTSVMVPQLGSSRNSSLTSLASLAGFDLGTANMSGSDLSPLVYPQIVSSIPFRKELMYTPLHYEKADTAVCMFTYAKEYDKPTVISYILKYTIGLPGVILGSLRKEKPDPVIAGGEGDNTPKPIMVTKDEEKIIKVLAQNVNLAVDKKEGYLTLSVTGSEPLQTAELALKAQQLLQEEITRFRTEKAQDNLDYIQARYYEIKAEAESYQTALATIRDRNQNMTTTRSQIEQERLQSKYMVANSIYSEMAKQLEQAKMQVKRDTPVLTIVQPVSVPRKPSNSRAKTLIVWAFLGGILGCGIVLGKGYLPKVKEMFAKTDKD